MSNVVFTVHDLGLAIRATRKSLGLTQADVALAAGVGLRFVSDLENGKATVQLGTALRVAQALGLQITVEGGRG